LILWCNFSPASHAKHEATPSGVFNWQRARPVRGLGALSAGGARSAPTEPKARPPTSDWGYQKDIPNHCLRLLSEISDNAGNQKSIFIRSGVNKVLKIQEKTRNNF